MELELVFLVRADDRANLLHGNKLFLSHDRIFSHLLNLHTYLYFNCIPYVITVDLCYFSLFRECRFYVKGHKTV